MLAILLVVSFWYPDNTNDNTNSKKKGMGFSMEYLKIDDFTNYRFIDSLKLSPNGKYTALLGRKANDDNDYDVAIYIDKGDGFFPLTNPRGKINNFIWLDDENILFTETREKEDKEKTEKGHELTCFYKININGGEASLAFKADAIVTGLELLESGKFLASTLIDNAKPALGGKTEEETGKLLKEIKKESEYQIVDELPYWFNGRGFINKKRIRLNILTEESLKPITNPLTNVEDYKLSPCKKYVLYTGDTAPADIHRPEGNLYRLDLETLEEREILEGDKRIRAFDFTNDKVLVSYAEPEQRLSEHGHFYIVDPATRKACLLAEFDLSIGSAGNSDSKFGSGIVTKMVDGIFYFIALNGYYTDIYALDVNSGKIRNYTDCKGNMEFFDIEAGRMVAAVMETGRLMEVFDIKPDGLKKTSSFNDEIHATRKYSAPEHFTFIDQEGVEVDGWVMKPVDYEDGKKYPAILSVHGGPKTAFSESYFHEMQYWANQNYFVMFSNPRGSDGKGNEFADIRGKYGTIDYDNLMQFVDECIERYPDIDPDKMGVTGGSYGGFMTNWIIGHTTRFKAAATQRCISNWISLGYISDIGHYFLQDQMQANPWDDIDKIWWHSPLKYVPNVKTPTLILHSDEDFRCWIPEGYQLFTALKIHGVETRMCVFRGENHELSRSGKPDHRVRRLKEITEWMDKYLKI